jgi:uncharacterized protein (DUF697 family)
MPVLSGLSDAGGGALGAVRSFVNVVREISFDEVRDQAETLPKILVLAPTEAMAHHLAAGLTGLPGNLATTVRDLSAPSEDLDRFDAVVVVDPGSRRRHHPADGGAVALFPFDGPTLDDPAALERLRSRIVTRLPDRAPAFGRAFPVFRPAATKALIDETARANAQFALVSNVPAVIPIIGSLASAGADFLVLTKNQVMMMFKLAAIHGRDLHDHFAIIQELVPVVGAGLLWRTVAREAASFLPLAAGTIPKVAIAYTGTVAVGRAADFYYRTNLRPTREQMRGYYRQAAEAIRRVPLSLPLPLPAGKRRGGPPPSVPAPAGDDQVIEIAARIGDEERTTGAGSGA